MGRVHTSGRSARASSASTSSGTSSATASPTSPRTSWRSGTARRIASRCSSSRRASRGPSRSSRGSSSRTASSRTRASCRSTTSSTTRSTAPTTIAIYLSPMLREPEIVGVTAGEWLDAARSDARCATAASRVDRARRPAAARARGRARGVGLPVVLLRALVRRPLDGEHARPAGSGSSPSRTSTSSGGGSTSRAARARRATAARSPTSPPRGPASSRPAASPRPGAWVGDDGHEHGQPATSPGVVGAHARRQPAAHGRADRRDPPRTARPLPGASFTWSDDAGSGVIDPVALRHRGRRDARARGLT